jgi:hypothetical protein
MRWAAAIVLGIAISAVSLGACGSSAPKPLVATAPAGQSLMFKDGGNYVALGNLDQMSAASVEENCANDSTTGLGFPDEPTVDVSHFAAQVVDRRYWRAGCEAAAHAITALGRFALAQGGNTPLRQYPAPAEQNNIG